MQSRPYFRADSCLCEMKIRIEKNRIKIKELNGRKKYFSESKPTQKENDTDKESQMR